MYASSPARLDMLRTGGGIVSGYVTAWYAGVQIVLSDGSMTLPLTADGSNSVPVDGTTPGPRRSLSLTLAPIPDEDFDSLARIGVELYAYTQIEYLDGSIEIEPQGRFDVDVAKIAYGPAGTITINALDRWTRIQYARFASPRASTVGATVRAQIASLITEVIPSVTVSDQATSTATVPVQTWDRDRDKAIQDLCTAASLDVFFDRNGIPVIRDAPVLNPLGSVFTVDASETGVLVAADRERNRQKTYNVVVVNPQTTDGSTPFAPQIAWDNDSTSPTFAGPGVGTGALTDLPSASLAGPFGQRLDFLPASSLVTSTGQARAAAATRLARVTGQASQVTASSVPLPMLDDGDTIVVQFPPTSPLGVGLREVHLVDSFTVPLVPHKDPMPISTRSTRPDDVPTS